MAGVGRGLDFLAANAFSDQIDRAVKWRWRGA